MTPITCAVIIIHYSNVQLILIVYNTANTSAQTLIENTDRKMINYRATMSLMSNWARLTSFRAPFTYARWKGSTSVPTVSKEGCIKNLAYGEVCMEKTFFLSERIPRCPTDQKLVGLVQHSGPAQFWKPPTSPHLYMLHIQMTAQTTGISVADFRPNLTWFCQILSQEHVKQSFKEV